MSVRRPARALGVAALAVVLSAHIGSPDVFFAGSAGPYAIKVVVRPPEVVPGVARVTVRAPAEVQRVSIRPVFWRAGSKGAPSADQTRRLAGDAGTFEGSLWLMARGAYTVDVIVEGARGTANVLVPVPSVATGRLDMNPPLAGLLFVLGIVLFAGLVNIVYKAAGESLLAESDQLDAASRRRAQRVAAFAVPVLAVAVFGGARWWGAVDRDYERTMYRPAPLGLSLQGNHLEIEMRDSVFVPGRRVSRIMPDHGKLMHLFLVRAGDAGAFAHLHPQALDSSASPRLATRVPPLPVGEYHVYGDVVHETGLERTLLGKLQLNDPPRAENSPARSTGATSDADDAWFVGDAATGGRARLSDGSLMDLAFSPAGDIQAGSELTIRVRVTDPSGKPARLEPYLGMPAHGVVARVDGSVYVHLHPMGTITMAAQEAFRARDRGDTTASGRLMLPHHAAASSAPDTTSMVEFPYAFPKAGSYRLFVQVRRGGRVLTGAFAVPVLDAAPPRKP